MKSKTKFPSDSIHGQSEGAKKTATANHGQGDPYNEVGSWQFTECVNKLINNTMLKY